MEKSFLSSNSWEDNTNEGPHQIQVPIKRYQNLSLIIEKLQALQENHEQKDQPAFQINVNEYIFQFSNLSWKQQFNNKLLQQLQIERSSIEMFNEEQERKEEKKFTKIRDANSEYEIKQIEFKNIYHLKIFFLIHEIRLKQLQKEYNYWIYSQGRKLCVQHPKRQKLSKMFKNQLFELKNRIHYYHYFDQNIALKVKFSRHFEELLQNADIAAYCYEKRGDSYKFAIFYSQKKEKKQIKYFINNHMNQHMSIIDCSQITQNPELSTKIFLMVYSLLEKEIKKLSKEEQITIEKSDQYSSILIHDIHEINSTCFTTIKLYLRNILVVEFKTKEARKIYNSACKHAGLFPFMRVKLYMKGLIIAIDMKRFHQKLQNLQHFSQHILQCFLHAKTHKPQITIYLRTQKEFYNQGAFSYVQQSLNKLDKVLQIKNHQFLNQSRKNTKLVVGVKNLNPSNRKHKLSVFLNFARGLFSQDRNKALQKSLIYYDQLTHSDQSQQNISESSKFYLDQKDKTFSILEKEQTSTIQNKDEHQNSDFQTQVNENAISQQVKDIQDIQIRQNFKPNQKKQNKQKQCKSLRFAITEISYEPRIPIFSQVQSEEKYSRQHRLKKLQKQIKKRFPLFEDLRPFKVFLLQLPKKYQSAYYLEQKQKEFVKDSFYVSTILEKNQNLCHHFLYFEELIKLKKDRIFVFHQVKTSQEAEKQKSYFLPSAVIVFY